MIILWVTITTHIFSAFFFLYLAIITLNDRRKQSVNFGLVNICIFYNELRGIFNDKLVSNYLEISFFEDVFTWSYRAAILLSISSILSTGLIPNLLRWGGEKAIAAQLALRSTQLKLLTDKYNIETSVSTSIINDIENIKNNA